MSAVEMTVNSATLQAAADELGDDELRTVPAIGAAVSKAQVAEAARLMREADPSVITSPRHLAGESERPGFLSADGDDLRLVIGIFTTEGYKIRRDGTSEPLA